MNISILLLVILAGYLIGSISFARVITRMVQPGVDLDAARTHPTTSGEKGSISGIGAYTTSMALGGKYGGLVALFDMLKAFLPVLVLRIVYPEQPYGVIFSVLAVLGHNFPIYYRFKGGSGLSPMLGSLLVLEPIGMVAAMIAGMFIGILINQPATGMVIWLPMLTLWSIFVRNDIPAAIYSILLVALFFIADIPELKLAMEYRKEGRLEEYNAMIYDSAPMMRMIKRLSEKVRFWERDRLNQG